MLRSFLFTIACIVLNVDGRRATDTNVEKLDVDPDVYRNMSELIASKGYPVEEHTVQTADGYLLSLQRVDHGRSDILGGRQKEVILLIHGVLCNTDAWVINFPGQSLGFVLPDAGYDTWLLNTRGGTYSRKHVNLKTNQKKFWDFSFDEMARYDVPVTIDYILEVTGKKALYILAHSQGTSAVFAMLSDMPDYNDKVKLFIALAPVAFVWHSTSTATKLIPFSKEITLFTEMFFAGEFFPSSTVSKNFREGICQVSPDFCKNLFYGIDSAVKTQYNESRFGVYTAHFPCGTSVKSLLHYAQLFNSRKFRKFDYGPNNFEHYSQEQPPDYELCRITAPVALIWSSYDLLADSEDIDILRKQLKSLVYDYRIPYEYSHIDFFIAQNSPKMVNEPVLQLLANLKKLYV